MKKIIGFCFVALFLATLCQAAQVELADAGAFAVEDYGGGGASGLSPWLFAGADGIDPALSGEVAADGVEVSAPTNRIPFAVQSGTGQDNLLSVDASAIRAQAEREGWGWREWTVCGVCVVAVAAAAVLIVDATQRGSHTSGDDSSTHYNIGVGGEGNTVHVKIDSPETTTTRNGY